MSPFFSQVFFLAQFSALATILRQMPDPRKTNKGICHQLEDMVVIGLCSIICGRGGDFVAMECHGHARTDYLWQFLELPIGIAVSETFRRLFERLNPQNSHH